MKTMMIPAIKTVEKTSINVDAFLLGLKDLSTNFPYTYTVEEITTFIKNNKEKEVFLAINKNILNHEIPLLEETLAKIENLPIQGILYYDLSLLEYQKEGKIKHPLYWAQEHFTTNYLTIHYYQKEGVKGTLISSGITAEEILRIRRECETIMIVPIFGYLPMFVSRRNLIKNYQKTFGLKIEEGVYSLEKDHKKYPIIDDKHGTYAFASHILNGISAVPTFKKKGIDYILFNGIFLEEKIVNDVLDCYQKVEEENIEEMEKKVNELCKEETDTGFLYKETIYRVKGR